MSQPKEYIERFWMVIASIPAGKVLTYGRVAEMAGYPAHARAVGRCLKQLPKDTSLPWHRVINAQGRSSFPPGSPPYLLQLEKLRQEQVVVLGGRVKLSDYLWQGD